VVDQLRGSGVLGTIAGDDTVFVAPRSPKEILALVKRIRETLEGRAN